ncbi:MAG: hypothetical protein GBAus27B_000391 [Mycoplasmataceae bacterium]|nr:MAG: hypothetical protein GBAus27B_000391 [Mycoplasmataceae bacterium]
MVQIKIEFIRDEINKEDDNLVRLSVKEAKCNGKEITEISFTPLATDSGVIQKKDDLIAELKGSKKFELTYDDEKISKATDDGKPVVTFNETAKTLDIQWNNVFDLKKVETGKETLINQSIQEIKDKFKEKKFTSEQKIEILEENWEDKYRAEWDDLEEVEIKTKKEAAIKKITDFSSDNKDNKTSKAASAAKESTCESKADDDINKKLTSEGVTETELTDKSKTSLKKLKDGEITDENKRNEVEKEINKDIYEKSAEKKMTDLTTRVNKAIKNGKEVDMKSLDTELDNFIKNTNYQSKKADAEKLSRKLKDEISKNSTSENWFSQNWKMVTGGALLTLVITIGAVLYFRRNNDTEIE